VIKGLSRAIQEQVRENNIEGIVVARGLNITHLMFVDDVILFGSGKFLEWESFKEVMDLCCNATRMAFSPHKSYFLEVRWKEEDLVVLKGILAFEVTLVEVVFKYLGFFLKLYCYTKTDWN
jgi:hypothetical protein